MIDYNKELVSALQTILPTYYEMALTSKIKTPCISYQERNNYSTDIGNTLGYSKINYTVKVWSNSVKEIQDYSIRIDAVLRELGFKRVSAGELYDPQSTMIQKILNYEALALENY